MQKSLNDITAEDLVEIRRLAGLAFTPREVAMMLELEVEGMVMYCEFEDCDIYRAFHGGRLQREIDLREKIIKLAESGSSPAQTMLLSILQQSKIKMMDR